MIFGKKPPPIVEGSTALFGEKYDLHKVRYAYEQLFDALTAKFGGGTSTVRGRFGPLAKGVEWPHPGKGHVLEQWDWWAQRFDVLGESVTHSVGSVEAQAFILGRNWSVYDAAAGKHVLNNGKPVAELDPAPLVSLYGHTRRGETFGLNERLSEKVRAVVISDLAKFGFVYTTASYSRTPEVVEIFATVSFPHSVYGAGEDWLRVRCVAPSGAELEPPVGKN